MKDQDGARLEKLKAECADNLRLLWTLQLTYITQFGGKQRLPPLATGSDFWLALTKTNPPLVDPAEFDLFVCPLSGQKPRAGFTTYRGPVRAINKMNGDDAVGACEPGHHPDGTLTILKKTGDVLTVASTDPQYRKALETTVGVPAEEKK